LRIDEEIPHFKITFSMARTPTIADIALTRVAALGLNPMLPRSGFSAVNPVTGPPSDERHPGDHFLQYERAGYGVAADRIYSMAPETGLFGLNS
jgi:hypothetical protein